MPKVEAEAYIPFRLDALLSARERSELNAALTCNLREAAWEVKRIEEKCRKSWRIAHGTYFEGTLEYTDRDGETKNVDATLFTMSEFPGACSSWGAANPEHSTLAEFLVTVEFTVALWKMKGGVKANLLIRRGAVEYDVMLHQAVASIADALTLAALHKSAAKIVEPVANRIAECHMLDK